MIRRRTLLAGAAALGLMAGATSAFAEDPTKVGFVYLGHPGDHGWTYAHDQGRKALEEHFGDAVEVTIVENVPEGPDSERVIRQLAQGGMDIIFTTSFGYMDPTEKVAADFPDVKFEHATGYKSGPNFANYNARFHEGRYIQGMLAAKMSKTGKIGYIASFPIPEVIMGINATMQGAKSVNPDMEISIIWVSSWFDPGKEADAANALIDQGADVLMQHTDSPAAMTAAQEKGIYAFGQASDMSKFGPDAQLTAIVNNWGPYYIERVQAIKDGTWETGSSWNGFDAGLVEMAPYNATIPADVVAEAEAAVAAIASGELNVFTGPINKQDGSVYLAEGETAELGSLWDMNFYVEGIASEYPQ